MTPEQICKMAANGNKDAERFCVAWLHFAHTLDDLVDRDKPVDVELVANVFVTYTMELCGNGFFLVNKPMLFGLMVQAANCWLDATRRRTAAMSMSDPEITFVEADVLKGFYHEVIFHVSFICGGWPHLRRVTSECREYDFEGVKGGT